MQLFTLIGLFCVGVLLIAAAKTFQTKAIETIEENPPILRWLLESYVRSKFYVVVVRCIGGLLLIVSGTLLFLYCAGLL